MSNMWNEICDILQISYIDSSIIDKLLPEEELIKLYELIKNIYKFNIQNKEITTIIDINTMQNVNKILKYKKEMIEKLQTYLSGYVHQYTINILSTIINSLELNIDLNKVQAAKNIADYKSLNLEVYDINLPNKPIEDHIIYIQNDIIKVNEMEVLEKYRFFCPIVIVFEENKKMCKNEFCIKNCGLVHVDTLYDDSYHIISVNINAFKKDINKPKSSSKSIISMPLYSKNANYKAYNWIIRQIEQYFIILFE